LVADHNTEVRNLPTQPHPAASAGNDIRPDDDDNVRAPVDTLTLESDSLRARDAAVRCQSIVSDHCGVDATNVTCLRKRSDDGVDSRALAVDPDSTTHRRRLAHRRFEPIDKISTLLARKTVNIREPEQSWPICSGAKGDQKVFFGWRYL
jgi:hypothetical protein